MFFRTIIIYLLLLAVLRLMGKRQIGELQPSELVTTFLLSEIASQPIADDNIPIVYGIVPVIVVLSIEVISSFIVTKFAPLKKLFLGSPSILINKGKLDIKELKKCRLSAEELLSELREKDIFDLSDVRYCILEENGKLSVVPNAESSPVKLGDMNISSPQLGFAHPLVVDGKVNKNACKSAGRDEEWIKKQLKKRKISDISLVFILTCDDCGNVHIVLKQ